MKVSVSLPDEDVRFVDDEALAGRYGSRSAVIHAAIRLLRDLPYQDSYAIAWDEWEADGEDVIWEKTAQDGLR
jgi:Arc/MetJ-type ribon-helix-helix transcriptional regulator